MKPRLIRRLIRINKTTIYFLIVIAGCTCVVCIARCIRAEVYISHVTANVNAAYKSAGSDSMEVQRQLYAIRFVRHSA